MASTAQRTLKMASARSKLPADAAVVTGPSPKVPRDPVEFHIGPAVERPLCLALKSQDALL